MQSFATIVSLLLSVDVSMGISVWPTGQSQTVNIVQWDSNKLPRIYERSDELPITDDELEKLSKAGFDTPALVKMIEERRCACDASAAGLIRMKKAGVSKEVLAAVSLHALKPNRSIVLEVLLDFEGESRTAREGYLYFFLEDGTLTRVFTASVGDLLARRFSHEEMVNKADLLISKTVRRIHLADEVPLKTYGQRTLLVAFSADPSIVHPSQLRASDRAKSQTYTFQYPRSSIDRTCRLNAAFRRDALLADKWHVHDTQFGCEWN